MTDRCTIEGCENRIQARNLCAKHYKKLMQHGDPLAGRSYGEGKRALAWIEEHLASPPVSECVVWPFSTRKDGYGRLNVEGGATTAHRYICERVHGPAPSRKHHASHSCGNGHGSCVNREHLSWKTCRDNLADRVAHGTMNQGERHGNSKLTDEQIAHIRSSPLSSAKVAVGLPVDPKNVQKIRRRETWRHLP